MADPLLRRVSVVTSLYCFLGAVGVAAGAFGSHVLRAHLSERQLDIWHTAVFYLFIHVLAGLLFEHRFPGRGVGLAMVTGVVLFSGSLFALVLTGLGLLGAVTPIGGVLLIMGWLLALRLELAAHRSHG
jgi:uncharacterized membrane protein YgdD (TMEM256/DUF423 family)